MASSPKGNKPSTNATADDRAYTAWAQGTAAEAGVRNPVEYVNNNVRTNASGKRNPTVGQINRWNNR